MITGARNATVRLSCPSHQRAQDFYHADKADGERDDGDDELLTGRGRSSRRQGRQRRKSVDSAPGGVAAAIRGPADHRHPNRRVGAEPQDKGQLSQPPPTRRYRKNPSVSPARRSLRLSAPPSSFTRMQGHLGPEPYHLRSPIAVSGRPFSMRLPRCSGIRRCRRVGMQQRSPCRPVLSILAAEEVTFRM